jgi:hypothetical protein
MIDLSEFYQRPNKQCAVAKWSATLPPEQNEQFTAALAEPDIVTASIWRWVVVRNAPFQRNVLYLHRKGECLCQT